MKLEHHKLSEFNSNIFDPMINEQAYPPTIPIHNAYLKYREVTNHPTEKPFFYDFSFQNVCAYTNFLPGCFFTDFTDFCTIVAIFLPFLGPKKVGQKVRKTL